MQQFSSLQFYGRRKEKQKQKQKKNQEEIF